MNRLFVALLCLSAAVSCVGGGSSVSSADVKVRVPYPIAAEGYPAHVHLTWNDNVGSTYEVFRAAESGKFAKCAEVTGSEYMDFSIGKSDNHREYTYRICPAGFPVDSASAFEVKAAVPAASDSVLLDMVQKYTLKYFSDFAHPDECIGRFRKRICFGYPGCRAPFQFSAGIPVLYEPSVR